MTLGAITTTGGDVDVRTTGAGTLDAGGTIGTGGGAVLLSSRDALTVNTVTAVGGTVQLLSNQDGAGAQGFSQADGTTISGTGITITVNTGAGTGTGGAVVSDIRQGEKNPRCGGDFCLCPSLGCLAPLESWIDGLFWLSNRANGH